ncbi:MAG: NADH-quinone oxidoreductase subunit L [Hydrogenibacillus sp.]|nr:NADH-quinone oxidoreductase subunit L [Hydrogenibacillus sp.]
MAVDAHIALWLVLGWPFLSFVVLLVFGDRLRRWAGLVGSAAVFLSLLSSTVVYLAVNETGAVESPPIPWLNLGTLDVTVQLSADPQSALMIVIVGLVSFLVHVYSIGYMQGASRLAVYFQHLSLFTLAMLGLVLAPNLLELYIFWELVGLASFLLIGFDVHRPEARRAAQKAFLVTRFGDIGLFVALWLVYVHVGSFRFDDLFQAVQDGSLSSTMTTILALFIFLGAAGKSGQFPLHVWLPDAMEGPTPVSALIHAATMVAAGVYLVARLFPLFAASPTASLVVSWIGAFTALFAALVAVGQNDMKRVLAYSTISQLGYMMHALGVGSAAAAMFHLTTHAFFKALLFLGAGAVYTAIGTYDLRRMGGLWKKMPFIGMVFLLGMLALIGIPPLSGYFSKERILAQSSVSGSAGFWLLLATVPLTALYMGRMFGLAFLGPPRGEPAPDAGRHGSATRAVGAGRAAGEARPVPTVMRAPLWVLSALTVIAGFVETEAAPLFSRFLGIQAANVHGPRWLAVVSTALALLGLFLAYAVFVQGEARGARAGTAQAERIPWAWLKHGFYIDALYARGAAAGASALGRAAQVVDRGVLEGLVALTVGAVRGFGYALSRLQNGQIQRYNLIALLFLVVILLAYVLTS